MVFYGDLMMVFYGNFLMVFYGDFLMVFYGDFLLVFYGKMKLVAIILLSQMYQYLVLSFFITKTIELRL